MLAWRLSGRRWGCCGWHGGVLVDLRDVSSLQGGVEGLSAQCDLEAGSRRGSIRIVGLLGDRGLVAALTVSALLEGVFGLAGEPVEETLTRALQASPSCC